MIRIDVRGGGYPTKMSQSEIDVISSEHGLPSNILVCRGMANIQPQKDYSVKDLRGIVEALTQISSDTSPVLKAADYTLMGWGLPTGWFPWKFAIRSGCYRAWHGDDTEIARFDTIPGEDVLNIFDNEIIYRSLVTKTPGDIINTYKNALSGMYLAITAKGREILRVGNDKDMLPLIEIPDPNYLNIGDRNIVEEMMAKGYVTCVKANNAR